MELWAYFLHSSNRFPQPLPFFRYNKREEVFCVPFTHPSAFLTLINIIEVVLRGMFIPRLPLVCCHNGLPERIVVAVRAVIDTTVFTPPHLLCCFRGDGQ